jgi:hypothetical protein
MAITFSVAIPSHLGISPKLNSPLDSGGYPPFRKKKKGLYIVDLTPFSSNRNSTQYALHTPHTLQISDATADTSHIPGRPPFPGEW